MDNGSMQLTNREQQACCGSECGSAGATEMETNAAGGNAATGSASVATSEDWINYFSWPNRPKLVFLSFIQINWLMMKLS